MSVSHILKAVQPVATNYILTSTDNKGNGSWQDPSTNPLIGPSVVDMLISTNMNFPGQTVPYVFRIQVITYNLVGGGTVKNVTLHFPSNVQHASGSPATISFDYTIPADIRPNTSNFATFIMGVDDNSVLVTGALNIQSSGSMTIGVGPVGQDQFQATNFCGIPGETFISWNTSSNQ